MPTTATITLASLQDIRAAVWEALEAARLAGDLGAGVSLARSGTGVSMPYVAVGPAYRGGGKQAFFAPPSVVVQIEGYASSTSGGPKAADDMMWAATEALSEGITLTFRDGQTRQLVPIVEDEALNPDLRDAADGPTYAQRFVRIRFEPDLAA